MYKKGFTLIELICVIVIIGMLLILAIPSITNIVKEQEENISSTMENIILKAGELYTQDNSDIYIKTEGNVYCIQLKELVDEEYLSNPIIDPVSNDEINQSNYIKITIQNEMYNYEITNLCNTIKK